MTKTLRKAFPSGLTNILVVLTAQAFMAAFHMPLNDGQTISTAILCTVGLLVLFKVCQPFTLLRKLVLGAMTIGVVGAFFVLPPLIGYLDITDSSSWLVFVAVLVMTPTVFFVLHRIFDWGEQLYHKLRKK